MDIRKLQRAIVDGLEDVKAQHIVVFNTEHLSPLFERVIIASGASNRQTKALANSVRETVKGRGMQVLRTEGEDNGEWIIVDCGAAVVHVMQPAIRSYYHLEELWGDKPVKMKLESVAPRLVKAAAVGRATPHGGTPSRADTPLPGATTSSRSAKSARPPSGKAPARAPAKARTKAPEKAPVRAPGKAGASRSSARKGSPAAPARKGHSPAGARKSAPRKSAFAKRGASR